MKIFVTDGRATYPGSHPALTLVRDSWDDYGFKTTYFVTLWTDQDASLELSTVKIMRSGLSSGQTLLDSVYEEGLPDDYASLGADFDYYEQVKSLEAIGADIFRSLRDMATDPERYETFKSEHAFEASLHRLAPARDALRRMRSEFLDKAATDATKFGQGAGDSNEVPSEAPPVENDSGDEVVEQLRLEPAKIVSAELSTTLHLEFAPSYAERHLSPTPIEFDFGGPAGLPNRIVALVGPNGTGKTTLLADLASAVFFGGKAGEVVDTASPITISSGSVREVIFISYSAYDSFGIPETQELGGDVRSELAAQGYVYVGLRKLDANEVKRDRRDREATLKSIGAIDREFIETLTSLNSEGSTLFRPGGLNDRRELFAAEIRKLFEDPSLRALAQLKNIKTPDGIIKRVSKMFPSLSTGHKAVLNIMASLCLHLNQNSLVLMDEPEAHLHPPLIASLLRVVRGLLERFQANAIVATHSPVVIQETLGEHVLILRRDEDRTSWRRSSRQTFGENLSALTRDTFGLPAAQADYIARLRDLIQQGLSIDQVEELFGERGMSSPARAQAIRLLGEIRMDTQK